MDKAAMVGSRAALHRTLGSGAWNTSSCRTSPTVGPSADQAEKVEVRGVFAELSPASLPDVLLRMMLDSPPPELFRMPSVLEPASEGFAGESKGENARRSCRAKPRFLT